MDVWIVERILSLVALIVIVLLYMKMKVYEFGIKENLRFVGYTLALCFCIMFIAGIAATLVRIGQT